MSRTILSRGLLAKLRGSPLAVLLRCWEVGVCSLCVCVCACVDVVLIVTAVAGSSLFSSSSSSFHRSHIERPSFGHNNVASESE